jgi:hypothetical protein
MIARVKIDLPFNILIAKEEQIPVHPTYEFDYLLIFHPPMRDDDLASKTEPEILKIDEKDAFYANCILIDFFKDDFNRSDLINFDPPLEKIYEVLNFFLMRLRRVTLAPQIHPLQINSCNVSLRYLTDDGLELEKETGKIRGRHGINLQIKYVALNKEIWNDLFSLQVEVTSQHWTDLLLDAKDELPDVGPSVVLAFTALEVFISDILNQLAKKENVSSELWSWINSRQKEPKTEEQYDTLLTIFTGHSLKEEEFKLWDAFHHLKSARDTFVHEGIARISKKTEKKLDVNEASVLIQQADEIILKIREWVPKEIQWEIPKAHHKTCTALWKLQQLFSIK